MKLSVKAKRRLVVARRFVWTSEYLSERFIAYMMNLIFHRGRAGEVDFGCDESIRDGYIILRHIAGGQIRDDGYGQPIIVNYRIANRWYGDHDRIPGPLFVSGIVTQALETGFALSGIVWKDSRIPLFQSIVPRSLKSVLRRV